MRADGSRPWLGCAALLAALLAASNGRAAEPTISLRWLGAGPESGCLGQRGLSRAVSESLGREAFSPAPADREVVVWVGAREGVGFRALIRVRDGSRVLGERELVSEGASCSTLDEPLAFAVGLMVDSAPLPPEPEPEPEPEPPLQEHAPEPAFRRFELGLSAVGVSGALPEPTLGLDFGAELRALRWLGVRGHVVGLWPRARELGPAQARFGLYAGGVALCPGFRGERFAALVCLGLDWGSLSTDTDGLDSNGAGSRRFLATTAAAEARLRVTQRLWLGASGGALVPHDRERFTYRLGGERHTAFQPSAICPRLGLGAALEL